MKRSKAKTKLAEAFGNDDVPFPEDLLYTLEQLKQGMAPGYRPLIPAWHLVDGVIKLTYWHAIKYYCATLTLAHKAKKGCTNEEAKEFVEEHFFFRSVALEEVLRYLLDAYPPYVEGDEGFPQRREWELVRNRTSECPQPPVEEDPIKPYKLRTADETLMRIYLKDIFEGEPDRFFEYLHKEVVEQHSGLEEFRNRIMSCADPERSVKMADDWQLCKSRHDDLLNWLKANSPQA